MPYFLPLQVKMGPGCVLSDLARDAFLSHSSLPQLATLKLIQLTASSLSEMWFKYFLVH